MHHDAVERRRFSRTVRNAPPLYSIEAGARVQSNHGNADCPRCIRARADRSPARAILLRQPEGRQETPFQHRGLCKKVRHRHPLALGWRTVRTPSRADAQATKQDQPPACSAPGSGRGCRMTNVVKFPYNASRRVHSRKPRISKNGTPEERVAKAATARSRINLSDGRRYIEPEGWQPAFGQGRGRWSYARRVFAEIEGLFCAGIRERERGRSDFRRSRRKL